MKCILGIWHWLSLIKALDQIWYICQTHNVKTKNLIYVFFLEKTIPFKLVFDFCSFFLGKGYLYPCLISNCKRFSFKDLKNLSKAKHELSVTWKWYQQRKRLCPHVPLALYLMSRVRIPSSSARSIIRNIGWKRRQRVNTAEIQDIDYRILQFIQYNEFLKSWEIKTLAVLQS